MSEAKETPPDDQTEGHSAQTTGDHHDTDANRIPVPGMNGERVTAAKRVFDYSAITRYIETEATKRMVSPWTLLGGALTRAALATPCD